MHHNAGRRAGQREAGGRRSDVLVIDILDRDSPPETVPDLGERKARPRLSVKAPVLPAIEDTDRGQR